MWATDAARTLVEALGETFAHDGVVIAAAALDGDDTAIAATSIDIAGASGGPEPLPTGARFEIGSVTKTMTAAMIALLVERGRLGLDDPIGRWLDAGAQADLTIRQLATHTSGLPAVGPSRMAGRVDSRDPWAGYAFTEAERDLRAATVAPGRPHRYSNLGYQLLGSILERVRPQLSVAAFRRVVRAARHDVLGCRAP